MELTTRLSELKGVGPQLSKKLFDYGLETALDLALNVPRKYIDYSTVVKIKAAKPGQLTIKGKLESVKSRYVRRGLHITEATVDDGTGKLKAIWFHQPYRAASLPKAVDVYLSGNYELVSQSYVLNNPYVEKVTDFTKNTARIIPIYPETKQINSSLLRRLIAPIVKSMSSVEILPPEVVGKQPDWRSAVREVHFPSSLDNADAARRRLAFDELFGLILAHKLSKKNLEQFKAPLIPFDESLARKFVAELPFQLTTAQRRAAWEILQDIASEAPMNRLLQGDVGSGKTVVAAFVALMAASDGKQTAVMAPTEVLAGQHFATLKNLLDKFGVSVTLLTGSQKAAERTASLKSIKKGNSHVIVGTHALIQKSVEFKNLGLVVVDEQHRFGVRQRQALIGKGKLVPHLLSMTATPIPRSLTLTLYGELDVSVLNELPPGRRPVTTKIAAQRQRETIYAHVDEELEAGRQAYVICPLVEDSDVLGVKSVTSEYDRLQNTVFAHRRIGLLHGKLSAAEKDQVLGDFKQNKLDILISTTVVEVGVDVPNATVLIVEGAERFGLAQLHQLRGRVGRSSQQSYCYLISSADHVARQRLAYLERTTDGFELAEIDLDLRGGGEVYGTRQHGELDLKIAKLTDLPLIKTCQQAVELFLSNDFKLADYPILQQQVKKQQVLAHLN